MRIVPLMDRVLLKQIEVEQKTGGGIILAGAGEAKITHLHGKVLAKGPGKQKASGEYVPIPFAVGDLVIYGNVSSTLEDAIDGEPVFLVEQNAIVALLVEDIVRSAPKDYPVLGTTLTDQHCVAPRSDRQVRDEDVS